VQGLDRLGVEKLTAEFIVKLDENHLRTNKPIIDLQQDLQNCREKLVKRVNYFFSTTADLAANAVDEVS
jgi:hypothetical protein